MAGAEGFVFIIVLALLAPLIYIYYRFLRTLRDLLRAVDERNRTMAPDLVWLNFIPVFGLVWMFVTVIKIRDSAQAECAYRGLRHSDFGFGVGMTYAATSVISEIYVPFEETMNDSAVLALAVMSWILSLTSLICWLFYWTGSSQLKDLLSAAAPAPGSPASPGHVGYQPRSWELPPETDATDPDQSYQPAPWLSARSSQDQPAPWLSARSSQDEPGPWLGSQRSPDQAGEWSGPQPLGEQTPSGPSVGGQPLDYQAGPWLSGQSTAPQPGGCPSCGTVGHSTGGLCLVCGKPTAPSWSIGQAAPEVATDPVQPATGSGSGSCPFCGTAYDTKDRYCWWCGRSEAQTTSSEQEELV
jgi:hypothetical protein